jgi:anaerobic ribonucleoside-triphosphate reductase activating protein
VRCTDNCINPAALVEQDRYLTPVDEAIEQARERLRSAPHVEGVTILGGEPTDQPEALSVLLSALRSEGLGVMLYSGHTWERLQRRMEVSSPLRALFDQVDLLIDGPFLDKRYDPALLWRGSSNQRIRCLTDRYEADALSHAPVLRGVDILLTPEGRLHLSGMHNPEVTHSLEETLLRVARLG